MRRQQLSCFLTDMTDAQTVDHPIQIIFLGGLQRSQQFIRRLFPQTLQTTELLSSHSVKVIDLTDNSGIDQQLQHRRSQAVDVHGILGGKMDQMPHPLGRAFRVDAAQIRLVLLPHRQLPAGGAYRRQLIRHTVGYMMHYPHDLRDDLACLTHGDGIADAQCFLIDKILIMQGRPADRRARQRHRIKDTRRRQHTGAPHVDLHRSQHRFLFLRRIFERHRPFRKFRRAAQRLPLCKAIHLYNSAVDIVGQLRTAFPDLANLLQCFFNGRGHQIAGNDRKTQLLHPSQ